MTYTSHFLPCFPAVLNCYMESIILLLHLLNILHSHAFGSALSHKYRT